MKNFLFNLKMEWLYLISMLIIGSVMIFLTPPFQTPDEVPHFIRIYQISEGIIRATPVEEQTPAGLKIYPHANMPSDFFSLLSPGHEGMFHEANYYDFSFTRHLFSIPINFEKRYDISIPNTGIYSPLVYAPQILFTCISRAVFGTVGAVYYSARFGAVLFTAICIFFAMKLIPEKKLLIFIVAFMPMFLVETASVSPDPVIYSITILGTAYFFYLRKGENLISGKEIFFIMLLACCIGLAKQVYGVILLLYFFIPMERFGGKKKFYLYGALMIFLYLFSAFTWLYFSKVVFNISYHTFPSPEVNIESQTAFIKENFFKFLEIMFSTFITAFYDYYIQFIGVLGWLSVFLPDWFYYFYGVLLIVGAVFGNLNLNLKQRLIMFACFVPVIIALYTHFYIVWSPVGNSFIEGIQGRYFIPCAIMCLSSISFVKNNSYEILIAFISATISSSVTILTTIERFYI